MDKAELLKYGNELTICGFIVGNGQEYQNIIFPDEGADYLDGEEMYDGEPLCATHEEIHQIIRQMDVQDIEGLQKVILRKSQRNIDTRVNWQVFRRDKFTCVYCGADDVPMTVDHIVLWEHMGDSVPDNLNCSCKKCNKTRGSMDYEEWLDTIWLKNIIGSDARLDLQTRGHNASLIPLRKTKRSR